jgi:glutamate-1-semialdehyde aminotransferase
MASSPLATTHSNLLQAITSNARDAAMAACRAALENLAVHEGDYRPHMTVEQRQLRNRLRARGKALGDQRDERSSHQVIKHLSEEAAF